MVKEMNRFVLPKLTDLQDSQDGTPLISALWGGRDQPVYRMGFRAARVKQRNPVSIK